MDFNSLMMIAFLSGVALSRQHEATTETLLRGCTLDGKSYKNGDFTPERCMRYKCVDGVWKYHDVHSTCAQCHSSSTNVQNTEIRTYVLHLHDGWEAPKYQFNGMAGTYRLSQKDLGASTVGVNITFIYTEKNINRVNSVLYTESGIEVELKISPNKPAQLLVNGKVIVPTNEMYHQKSEVGIVYISMESNPRGGEDIHVVGSQGLAISIRALNEFAWDVHTYAMDFLENKLYGLCDVYTNTEGQKYPKHYIKEDGMVTTSIPEFTASWKKKGAEEEFGIDQRVSMAGTKSDCILDGQSYPDGSLTPSDRCIRYQCENGVWRYLREPSTCLQCEASAKLHENTLIRMYEVHLIDGILTPSYLFPDKGRYSLTQYGLESPLGFYVLVDFIYTQQNETRITNVFYAEGDLTVELNTGPGQDSQILVNGKALNVVNVMVPVNSSLGTVYISNDSPNWPRPHRGGNIHIVGSQGLAVSIYALHGYAWFVNAYAMPSLNDHLYGLCDVLDPWDILIPEDYTMENGTTTTNLEEFIQSWKLLL